jgi:uncharacterized metal-binding protein
MPKLPERKVGIIACSGEELAEGTVARLATLKVLHDLRRGRTVTICLPLFLAGGEGDRAFARFHPTITVDGCDLRCAARGTEMYSGKPTASLVVSDLLAEAGLPAPAGRRCLNDAGERAVAVTADRLAQLVDQVLEPNDVPGDTTADRSLALSDEVPVGTCSCGSGIPVTRVAIDGRTVDVLAMALIFRQFCESGGRVDDPASADRLMATVKIYNEVPPVAEASYREAILREYKEFCAREGVR